MNRDYRPMLRTLRRVPDDIILAVATREIDTEPYDDAAHTCICGWVYREWMARLIGIPAEDVTWTSKKDGATSNRTARLAAVFGGTARDWDTIFIGITDFRQRRVEEAFTRRVNEAVGCSPVGTGRDAA